MSTKEKLFGDAIKATLEADQEYNLLVKETVVTGKSPDLIPDSATQYFKPQEMPGVRINYMELASPSGRADTNEYTKKFNILIDVVTSAGKYNESWDRCDEICGAIDTICNAQISNEKDFEGHGAMTLSCQVNQIVTKQQSNKQYVSVGTIQLRAQMDFSI